MDLSVDLLIKKTNRCKFVLPNDRNTDYFAYGLKE